MQAQAERACAQCLPSWWLALGQGQAQQLRRLCLQGLLRQTCCRLLAPMEGHRACRLQHHILLQV